MGAFLAQDRRRGTLGRPDATIEAMAASRVSSFAREFASTRSRAPAAQALSRSRTATTMQPCVKVTADRALKLIRPLIRSKSPHLPKNRERKNRGQEKPGTGSCEEIGKHFG